MNNEFLSSKLFLPLVFSILTLSLFSCGGGGGDESGLLRTEGGVEENSGTYLFVLNAEGGELTSDDGSLGRLVLQRNDPNVVYFADRPGRDVGSVSLPQFVSQFSWFPTKPNAALTFDDSLGARREFVVELSRPTFQNDLLSFPITFLQNYSENDLSSFGIHDSTEVRALVLHNVSLFIDDGSIESCYGSIASDTKVKSYSTSIRLDQINKGDSLSDYTRDGSSGERPVQFSSGTSPGGVANHDVISIQFNDDSSIIATSSTCFLTSTGVVMQAGKLRPGLELQGIGSTLAIENISLAKYNGGLHHISTRTSIGDSGYFFLANNVLTPEYGWSGFTQTQRSLVSRLSD